MISLQRQVLRRDVEGCFPKSLTLEVQLGCIYTRALEGPGWERGSGTFTPSPHWPGATTGNIWHLPRGDPLRGQARQVPAEWAVSPGWNSPAGPACPSCRYTSSEPCPHTGYCHWFLREHPSNSSNKSAPKCTHAGFYSFKGLGDPPQGGLRGAWLSKSQVSGTRMAETIAVSAAPLVISQLCFLKN